MTFLYFLVVLYHSVLDINANYSSVTHSHFSTRIPHKKVALPLWSTLHHLRSAAYIFLFSSVTV